MAVFGDHPTLVLKCWRERWYADGSIFGRWVYRHYQPRNRITEMINGYVRAVGFTTLSLRISLCGTRPYHWYFRRYKA
jgi:hypothetical protein